MEPTVLANVENSQVEPERLGNTKNRDHVMIGQPPGADLMEQPTEQLQIMDHFAGIGVPAARRVGADDGTTGEAGPHEIDRLAPGLVGVPGHGGCTRRPEQFGGGVDPGRQLPGGRLDEVGQAEMNGESGELAVEEFQGLLPQRMQRALGDLGRDERMTVAVAAHPRAESESGEYRIVEEVRDEAGSHPRRPEPAVEAWDDPWEDPGQVMRDVSELVGDVRPLEEDLSGPPQSFQHRAEVGVETGLLLWRPHLVLAGHQEQVELAMLLENGGPLGLGRVSGEDRLDHDVTELCREGLGFVACVVEVRQDSTPGARDRRRTGRGLLAPPILGRGILLRQRREAEGDRQRLGEPILVFGDDAGVVPITPGQRDGDRRLPEVDEHITERIE